MSRDQSQDFSTNGKPRRHFGKSETDNVLQHLFSENGNVHKLITG